jgi:hypothetical protein
MQKHEDLGVALFAEHIRTLTLRFDSNLADAEKPIVSAPRQIPTLAEDWPLRPKFKLSATRASRPVRLTLVDGQVDQKKSARR